MGLVIELVEGCLSAVGWLGGTVIYYNNQPACCFIA